jgi:acetyl esterase/lipase
MTSIYMNGGNASGNPMFSPVFASDDILKRFPPTRIMACEADPLRDPAFEFALRLKKLNVDTRLYLMKDYMHAFCGFDDKSFGIAEYHNGTLKTEEIIKELL